MKKQQIIEHFFHYLVNNAWKRMKNVALSLNYLHFLPEIMENNVHYSSLSATWGL